MSSFKNASRSHQKVHRERHQPEERHKFGLLEKKKDYKRRANHAHEKEKTLKVLHKRALNKNPDEFYHHMINSKIQDDEHHENDMKDEHSKEQIALMETQDLKYIRMKRTIEAKKIERLQSQLHMIDEANTIRNKHTFFIDDDKNDLKEFDLAKRLNIHPKLLNIKTNRRRIEDIKTVENNELDQKTLKAANLLTKQSYQELNKRRERLKQLSIIQQKMELKRVLKQPRLLKPKKVRKGTKTEPAVYEFKYERKK